MKVKRKVFLHVTKCYQEKSEYAFIINPSTKKKKKKRRDTVAADHEVSEASSILQSRVEQVVDFSVAIQYFPHCLRLSLFFFFLSSTTSVANTGFLFFAILQCLTDKRKMTEKTLSSWCFNHYNQKSERHQLSRDSGLLITVIVLKKVIYVSVLLLLFLFSTTLNPFASFCYCFSLHLACIYVSFFLFRFALSLFMEKINSRLTKKAFFAP